jgi:hypothetical protein
LILQAHVVSPRHVSSMHVVALRQPGMR